LYRDYLACVVSRWLIFEAHFPSFCRKDKITVTFDMSSEKSQGSPLTVHSVIIPAIDW